MPPEIWAKVFDYATHIPCTYTCDDGPSLLAYTADEHGISLHTRHSEATILMLTASLVCKAWTSIATEFLFRYILVKNGDHVIKIANALKGLTGDSPHTSSPGRFTLRLELLLEGVHHCDTLHTTAMADIFQLCSNIQVFSSAFMKVGTPFFPTSKFMNSMEDMSMRSSIRRLELTGPISLPPYVLWLPSWKLLYWCHFLSWDYF